MSTRSAATYRPDIDGLRAIAVVAVLAYHYGAPFPWPLLPGGFTGVDVFFVISGFLITSKIAEEISAGIFSVLGFYDRRVRRILPALVVMLAATLLAGRFLLLPGDYQALAQSTEAAAFGISNFFFLGHTGYFDQSADLMPLIHTWSLAVEEQFYLVWPLLLFAIAAGRRRIDVAAITAVIAIAGFGLSLVWFDADPKSAFFMALPRAWELAIGAALVFLPPLPRRFGDSTALGLVLMATGFVRIKAAAFPGVAALLPCLGAALVIWPQREPGLSARWLGRLSPIGLISYSLYLWHWPVWVLFRIYINGGTPRIRESAALAAVSAVVAVLSYRYVERPFRKARWLPAQNVWAGVAACTLIFCAAAYVDRADGLPQRLPGAFAMRSREAMFDWPCKEIPLAPGTPAYCVFGAPWSNGAEKAVLWGDSNAEHIAPLLAPSAAAAHVSVALYIRCAAFINSISGYSDAVTYLGEPVRQYDDRCAAQYDALFQLLQSDPGIRTVILSASWNVIGLLASRQADGLGVPLFRRSMEAAMRRLAALGRRIVILATIPHWDRDPVPCALRSSDLPRRPCADADLQLTRAFYEAENRDTLAVFRDIAGNNPAVTLIEPGSGLCRNVNCITAIDGEFLYYDGAHFRRNLSAATDAELARLTGIDSIFMRRP